MAQRPDSTREDFERLRSQIAEAQAHLDASQRQLILLREALVSMESRLSNPKQDGRPDVSDQQPTSSSAAPSSPDVGELDEQQAIQGSEIATLNQAKVESSSKYPVTISGLILLNGFVNTGAVDIPLAPGVAFRGGGSTGGSLRQTSLGIVARGPSLGGAITHAGVNVDFLGDATRATTGDVTGLLRLRTARASLDWKNTSVFLQYDRPVINPNSPTSLVAHAQPPLAWSGDLWRWTPQLGVSQALRLGGAGEISLTGALIDTPDPPALQTSQTAAASQAENSRWPGAELHLGYQTARGSGHSRFGAGGYFGPHRITGGDRYDAWAATLDWQTALPLGLQLTGSFYRGLALGGLGGGAYKDFLSIRTAGGALDNRPLDDVGGWVQLKRQAGDRLEFNAALGQDNAFANELRNYPINSSIIYGLLARNRSIVANSIWSPRASLLFSLEYRYLSSFSVTGPVANSHVIGVAAGYKF